MATTTPVPPALGKYDTLPPWALLGVSKSGRGLLVATHSRTPDCVIARADVLEASANRVRLRVVYAKDAEHAEGQPCFDQSISEPPDVLEVPLPVKVKGQRILGDHRTQPKLVLDKLSRTSSQDTLEHRTFRLAGLRTADALTLLRGFGYRSRDLSVRGPRPGYVSAIEPRLPRYVKRSTPLVVRTQKLR